MRIYNVGGSYQANLQKILVMVCESAAKIKLSEPSARRHLFYKKTFITTKNKSYFIKLVNRTIK